MKKRIICALLSAVMVLTITFLTSCDTIGDLLGELGLGGESESEITRIEQSSFIQSSNPYRIVDSFSLEGGSDYYFFELGIVDYVPMNVSNPEGVYFDGKDMELEFNFKQTDYEESARLLEGSVEHSVELTTSSYVEGSVSAPLAGALEAGVTVGAERSLTSGITTTFKESYYNSVSKETSFEKNVTYRMGKNDPTGYYFYVPVASMKVFEVVVYNREASAVEYMFTYSQFGEALPGLFYSPTSFLDMSAHDITFDESRMPMLTAPTKLLEKDVTVTIEPEGADCAVTELQAEIGKPYPELPELSRQGYAFKGWDCNGITVESGSVVLSSKPLVAKWELITSVTIPINASLEVSSTDKLNPFLVFSPGLNGSTGGNATDLQSYFDFETLKNEGYKMRIVFESNVKSGWIAANAFGLEYKVKFRSNGSTFQTLTDNIKTSKYTHRKLNSDLILLTNINGNVDFVVSTENVDTLYMKDITVKIEFVK